MMIAVKRQGNRAFSPMPGARSTPRLDASTTLRVIAFACAGGLAGGALGCSRDLDAGTWKCGTSLGAIDLDDAGTTPFATGPVEMPWSAGFERGFCDYDRVRGFCYGDAESSFEVVTEPVRSGKLAAAFSITTASPGGDHQTRCVREGVLPTDAVYGAWYFIPWATSTPDNWNLMHFVGGDGTGLDPRWDVSLRSLDDGSPALYVRNLMRGPMGVTTDAAGTVPIGAWFHIEFRYLRAPDTTGLIELYQDGTRVIELRDLVTDPTTYGQWYVGNLAANLSPPDSTLYVDDVTIAFPR